MGCNYNCAWCHNRALIEDTNLREKALDAEDMFLQLKPSQQYSNRVVITGGEPTIYGKHLVRFCEQLFDEGFRVRLDTNGSNPALIRELLDKELVQDVALDYKLPFNRYEDVIPGAHGSYVMEAMILLSQYRLGTIRTTTVPGLHTDTVLAKMEAELDRFRSIFGRATLDLTKTWTCTPMRPVKEAGFWTNTISF